MGEAITSPVPDSNEAYGEFSFNQTANAMAQDMKRMERFEVFLNFNLNSYVRGLLHE